MHRHCFALLFAIAIAFFASPDLQAQYGEIVAPPAEYKTGFDTITTEQATDWLNTLAGPVFNGRGTGQVGYTKAAHWVAGKVAEFGLEPVGDGGTYFQIMPMTKRSPDMDRCFLKGPDGLEIAGKGNLGFERYTGDAELTGKIAFLKINGNEDLPNDLELRDKIVIYDMEDTSSRARFAIARKRPAASIRVIDGRPESVSQTVFPNRRSRSTSVSGTITREAVTKLCKACGVDAKLFSAEKSEFNVTDHDVSITLPLREEKAGAPNVVAWLEGSDPDLKDEYVVIGAHLDHLGTRGGSVYPGADDNGSGSTAVLSIARAMALNPVKPKRSVLFMWFAAEEMGLIGSRYYTNNPLLPIEKMTCMFNIDMVGRNEDAGEGDADADNEGHIHLIGSKRGETALHDIVVNANKYVGFEFEFDQESVWNRSDQVNFYNKGVPVAFLFGGFHPDYHQPTDQPDKINFQKITSAAKLYYMALYGAAEHGKFEMKK